MSAQTVKRKPIIVGLTGGIATGKTTAAKHFIRKGIYVIDSDQIVSQLFKTDQSMVFEIEKRLGIYVHDDETKRELARLVFRDEEKLKILNQIVHPRVFFQIEQFKKANQSEDLIVIDMPLLIEVGYQHKCDYTILIDLSLDEQINRLMERNGLNEAEAKLRIEAQLPMTQKKEHVNIVIDNNGTKQELYHQLDEFLRSISYR